MADDDEGGGALAAGDFGTWVVEMQSALRSERDSDVPCKGCTACCTSSQFVHIDPEETDTLSHIPRELLFPAPRMPGGHMLLGYDERGHCPMLVDNACSIYEHRPRTCRTYDCRIFPAAAVQVDAGDDAKSAIARRTRRWEFAVADADDETRRAAVEAAARFLAGNVDVWPGGIRPSATALAVLAVELHELFLTRDEPTDALTLVDPDPNTVRKAIDGGSDVGVMR